MDDIIHRTAKYSLGMQIFTGVVDVLALQANLEPKDVILKQLVSIELIVQIIEGIFYIWLIKSFHTVKDITKFRYYDWSLSTSLMLYTLIIYLSYLQEPSVKTLIEVQNENKDTIKTVLSLNLSMLLFGYLGEIGKIDRMVSVNIGFIPFLAYYKIIYDKYVKNATGVNKSQIQQIFWYFFIFWSLYGVAAYMPYKPKNVGYNILDLFSKNFFGLFLAYQVFKKSR